ncbi:MAG: stalk domain-containing protein [Vulcanimicrobiaceae bacterium]
MRSRHFVAHVTAAVVALALCVFCPQAAEAQVGVTVNGSGVDISPPPIVQAGRVFVPLRGVFEQLGASVVYSNGTIDATGNGRDISLQIGSTEATVNGQPQTIDVAPFIVGESTYVPLRFISEALGDSVYWDDADSIAEIDTGGGPATYFSPGTASYVDTAPPPIPVYEQPYVPAPNYIWQPGYWAWGSYGYYWVPGTWVQAPQPGYLWTPGYWQWNNGGYNWSPGYWALTVGFYGGVNYGCGYYGRGYGGGRWSNNVFRYNTYVTRVNVTIVRNVYVDRTVYVNNSTTRISYDGGHGGVQARPTPQELAATTQRHLGMTEAQHQHLQAAEQDRRLVATVNHNKPPVLAVARPLSTSNRPAGFVLVKPSERVNPQANVAPVHVAPVHVARPAAHAAPLHVAPEAHAASLHVAPEAHAAPLHVAPEAHAAPLHVAPVVHAPPVHVAPEAHAAPANVAPIVHAPPVHVAPAAHAAAALTAPRPRTPAVFAAPQLRAQAVHPAPPPRAPAVHAVPPPRAPAAHAAPKRPS